MKQSTKFWEICDFTSKEAKLHIFGKDRYKTGFGAIISLLSIISIMILSGYFLFGFIVKNEVNVIGGSYFKKFVAYKDLNQKPLFFTLKHLNGTVIDQSIVQLIIKQFFFKDGIFTIEDLETEPCKMEKHLSREKYENELDFAYFNDAQCIKQDRPLNLTFDGFKNEKVYLNVYMAPCNNATSKITCKSKQRIEEVLSTANMYYAYHYPSIKIDHYNRIHPIQEIIRKMEKKVYYNLYYRYIDNFKTVNYTSDEGPVLEDLYTYSGTLRDESTSTFEAALFANTAVPNCFFTNTIWLNENTYDQYLRTFPKLQKVAAEIGGIVKFIMTLSSAITQFVTNQMLDVQLSNYFISEDDSNSKSEKKHVPNNDEKVKRLMAKNMKNKIGSISLQKLKIQEDIPLKNQIQKIRKLSIFEAILPKRCLKPSSEKYRLDDFSKIIKYKISTDQILDLFSEFENLKKFLLDKEKLEKFKKMKHPTLSEYLILIRNEPIFKGNENTEMSNLRQV